MKRYKYSLSHYKLLTCDMGNLVPLTWFEALPGDSMQIATSALIRVSPLLSPVMHPVRVRIHWWEAPLRILWEDFEDFITGGPAGTSTPTFPNISSSGTFAIVESDLSDCLGLQPTAGSWNQWSALPYRAYQTIWNEFYRDQDIVTEAVVSTSSGVDTTTETDMKRVAWEKDQFTTSRPWTQKGTEVTVPIAGNAPVKGIGPAAQSYTGTNQTVYESGETSSTTFNPWSNTLSQALYYEGDGSGYPDIYADLAAAGSVSISDLRESIALQKYMERAAKYGSRYVEYLRSLGVRSPARLQEPTYLGGGRQTIQFSEVLSTDDDGSSNYAGKLRGHGIGTMRTNTFRKFFDEHSIVMCLMSVIPKTIYADGMHKSWSRATKEDYWQKELQLIGEEAILNKELKMDHAAGGSTFGYRQIYDTYRSHPSSIAGEFRSAMNHWHYARIFASDPALNSTFIQANPTKRVNADSSNDCLYVMANHSIQSRRLVTKQTEYRMG